MRALPIRRTRTITITNGTSLSAGIAMGDYSLARIDMPAAWDAAGLSFQASADGVTWVELTDDQGNQYQPSAAASAGVVLDPTKMLSAQYLKIRSGTASAAVNQTADRILTLVEQYIL